MQNYMTKLNNVKKYILPFLFLVMTFVMIPKAAYYKKGTIDVVATTTEGEWNGYLYLIYPVGYKIENPVENINKEKILQVKIKNLILDKYVLYLESSVGKISKVMFTSERKSIVLTKAQGERYIQIPWKDIEEIYTISFINIFIYLLTMLLLIWSYCRNGIEIKLKNIGLFILVVIFLAICLNMKWLSKGIGLFLSLTLLRIWLDRKKLRFDYLEIVGILLLILSLASEYFNFFYYEKTYIYFQNTILIIIAMRVWKFTYEDKKILKKFFKIILILLSLINLISPLIFGGNYAFTFGVLMIILVADSIERLFFYNKNKYSLMLNMSELLLGLYGLIVSSRRTMIVGLIIYCIYLFVKFFKKNKKNTIILVSLGIIFSSIIIAVGFRGEKYRIRKLIISIVNIKTDKGNIQRLLMWRRGYYIGKENSIIGIGVDSFYKESIKEKYDNIKLKDEKFTEDFIHVHNEYIHQIITRGIPGAILFYGLWIYILSRLRKSKDKDFDIMLLIIYGVYGIFDPYSIRAESIVFYTFIGISFVNCLPVVEKENKILQKLGYMSTVIIFLIALYFNKRFRYYFLILLVIYIGYYFYNKRKREKYERI